MSRTVSAISFDADDTLWDFTSSERSSLTAAAERMNTAGLSVAGRPVTGEWLARVRAEIGPRMPGATLLAKRRASFAEVLRRCGDDRPEQVERMLAEYLADRAAFTRLFPEVRAVLAKLAARMPLAITTNGNGDPAWFGLEACFTAVVRADEAGVSKPDPAIYLVTAERLAVDPAELLHIGDHPDDDVTAARNAGLQARLLDRTGGTPGSLRSLAELL